MIVLHHYHDSSGAVFLGFLVGVLCGFGVAIAVLL